MATSAFQVFVPTLCDREMAPPGGDIIIVQKITNIDYSTVQDWAAHKASVDDYITANLERIVPGFSSRVVVKLCASALTSYRYTLNHRGAMLGWELAPDQLGADRPDVAKRRFPGHKEHQRQRQERTGAEDPRLAGGQPVPG